MSANTTHEPRIRGRMVKCAFCGVELQYLGSRETAPYFTHERDEKRCCLDCFKITVEPARTLRMTPDECDAQRAEIEREVEAKAAPFRAKVEKEAAEHRALMDKCKQLLAVPPGGRRR